MAPIANATFLNEGKGLKGDDEMGEEEGEGDEEGRGAGRAREGERKEEGGGAVGETPWEQLRQLVTELEAYERGLAFSRPALVVANKTDEPEAQGNVEELQRQLAPGGPPEVAPRGRVARPGCTAPNRRGRWSQSRSSRGAPPGPPDGDMVVAEGGDASLQLRAASGLGQEGFCGEAGVEAPEWVKGRMAVYPTCAVLGEGVKDLRQGLRQALRKRRA